MVCVKDNTRRVRPCHHLERLDRKVERSVRLGERHEHVLGSNRGQNVYEVATLVWVVADTDNAQRLRPALYVVRYHSHVNAVSGAELQVTLLVPRPVELLIRMSPECSFWEVVFRMTVESLRFRRIHCVRHRREVVMDGEVECDGTVQTASDVVNVESGAQACRLLVREPRLLLVGGEDVQKLRSEDHHVRLT